MGIFVSLRRKKQIKKKFESKSENTDVRGKTDTWGKVTEIEHNEVQNTPKHIRYFSLSLLTDWPLCLAERVTW